jgi:MFS family permease
MNKKVVTYIVSFAAFFGPFTQSIYTPLLPQVKQQFQTSDYIVNLTISIFTIVMALMQIVYGPLTDNVGRKKILLPGIVLYIAASIGCAFSTSIFSLLFFRVIQAAGIAVGSVVATTVIGDLYEGPSRGRAMGTFQMLVALGPAAGPVIGGFVGQKFGFHGVFWVLAGSGLMLLLLNFIFLSETRPTVTSRQRFTLNSFSTILSRPEGSAIIGLGFFQYFTFYNFLVFLPSLLVLYYHLSPSQNGLVFLPMSLAVVIGTIIGGRIQEYFQPRKFLIISSSLNVVATLLFAIVAHVSLIVLIISIFIFGLCLGVSLPVQTTLLTNVFSHNRATAIGLYNFFRFMGMGAGPMVGTFFYNINNRLEFIFAAFAFGCCVAFAAYQFNRPFKAES